jgi:hypothetical protein
MEYPHGGARDRPSWLPSDICRFPVFRAEEDAARMEIEAVKADLPKVIAALRNISYMLHEAARAGP